MFWKRRKKKRYPDYLINLDFQFENEAVWGVKNVSDKSFSYYLHHGEKIAWHKVSLEVVKREKEPFTEEEIVEELNSLPPKEGLVSPTEVISQESITLPTYPTLESEQEKKLEKLPSEESSTSEFSAEEKVETPKAKKDFSTNRKRKGLLGKEKKEDSLQPAPLDLLKMQSIQENLDSDKLFPEGSLAERDAEKDLENEEHRRMSEEASKNNLEDKRLSIAYNLQDFPLAEPHLVNELCEAHKVFFDYLSKLQETHTPTDFQTAYHIQDRIAYLIDNQTLLYKSLTKQLIKYLDRINEKLKKYYDEITLKQEDLRKLNAQISRFNEYDRKTKDRLNFVEEDTQKLKLQAESYQNKIDSITSSLEGQELSSEVKKS